MSRFASVVLVDGRGRVLLQERDEHPRIDPDKWSFVGGHVEDGEEFEAAAYRELEEETGVRLLAGTLRRWAEVRPLPDDPDHVVSLWLARTDLADADVACHEGRRIVFVEPDAARRLDLGVTASLVLPELLDSALYQELAR